MRPKLGTSKHEIRGLPVPLHSRFYAAKICIFLLSDKYLRHFFGVCPNFLLRKGSNKRANPQFTNCK